MTNAHGNPSSRDCDAKRQGPCASATVDRVSEPLARALERLRRFAMTGEPIVLLGESGTGKTYYAEWAHRQSSRAHGPFHRVNLGALDDTIAGAELFGYVPGAFTDARGTRAGAFASAQRGTLFLDEIGKASLATQRKLLDVIERHTFRPLGSDREVRVDVRLIFAANEDLPALVASGALLRDLPPRLGLSRVTISPLRERTNEIPGLVEALIARIAPSIGWDADRLPLAAPSLIAAIERYPWPGNVRELESLVRRLLIDGHGRRELTTDLLVDDLAIFDTRVLTAAEWRSERLRRIQEAITRNGGNRSRAARDLGIGRSTLYRLESAIDAHRSLLGA